MCVHQAAPYSFMPGFQIVSSTLSQIDIQSLITFLFRLFCYSGVMQKIIVTKLGRSLNLLKSILFVKEFVSVTY